MKHKVGKNLFGKSEAIGNVGNALHNDVTIQERWMEAVVEYLNYLMSKSIRRKDEESVKNYSGLRRKMYSRL